MKTDQVDVKCDKSGSKQHTKPGIRFTKVLLLLIFCRFVQLKKVKLNVKLNTFCMWKKACCSCMAFTLCHKIFVHY